MVFHRVLHDGLWAVINRGKKSKIVFVKGIFETKDPEQIDYLIDLGYAHDGEEVVISFDYAVRKLNNEGEFTGRAKKVCDTKEQAETYMLENDLDLDAHGIEERERK